MKDFEHVPCPDPVDEAAQHMEAAITIALRERAIQNQLQQEEPEEDDAGNRYCLDCGETIPPARVEAVAAVRCVHCASRREKQGRIGRQKGGAGRSSDEDM